MGVLWICKSVAVLWLGTTLAAEIKAPVVAKAMPPNIVLPVGKTITARLRPGIVRHYSFDIRNGMLAEIEILPELSNVFVWVVTPGGVRLISKATVRAMGETQTLYVAARVKGHHMIAISLPDDAGTAKISVRLRAIRPVESGDEKLLSLQADLFRALTLASTFTSSSRANAIEMFRKAQKASEEVGSPVMRSSILEGLGDVQGADGQSREAAETYRRATEFCRAGARVSCEARCLLQTGSLYDLMGQAEVSRRDLEQALALYQTIEDKRGQARVYKQLGEMKDTVGQKAEALTDYRRALELFRASEDVAGQGQVWTDIGVTQFTMSDSESAIASYRKAQLMLRAARDRQNEAVNFTNLGTAYEEFGEFDKAVLYLRRSIATLRSLGDDQNLAYALHETGVIHHRLGNDTVAIDYLSRALVLFRKVNDDRGKTTALNNLGRIYSTRGRLADALHAYMEARDAFQSASNIGGTAYALSNLGDLRTKLREWDQAQALQEQAMTLFQKVHDLTGEAFAWHRLARLEMERGNYEAAQQKISTALKIFESLRAQIAGQDQRASYFAGVRDLHEFQVYLWAQREKAHPGKGYAARAFEAAERAKARSLLDAIPELDSGILQGTPTELVARQRRIRASLRAKLQQESEFDGKTPTSRQSETLEEEIEGLLIEDGQAQSEIQIASPRYFHLRTPSLLTVERVQHTLLDRETVLIEYLLADEHSYAWLLSQNDLKIVALPGRNIIEATAKLALESFRHENAGATNGEPKLRLRKILLEPFREQIKGKRLVIAPDGVLHSIPFAALTEPSASHDVVVVPSASVLGTLRDEAARRQTNSKTAVIFADAVYERSDSRLPTSKKAESLTLAVTTTADVTKSAADVRGRARSRFSRLMGTADEARHIAEIAPPGSIVVTGPDLTRDRVLSTDFTPYRTVHFAVHGLSNSDHPQLSGLVLSLWDRQGVQTDGFLRLLDIYNMRVPVELVVLSACETAAGKDLKGEGVIGLTRGFLYAGAEHVLASLWRVPDESTSEFMRQFYDGIWRDNLRPDEALRRTQAAMARHPRWSDPYYWAGFVLYGDWR